MTEGDLRDKLKHFMTRRHLLIWQDHSTLANHGHLLLMIRIMYDPAIYYTPYNGYFECPKFNVPRFETPYVLSE